MCFELARELFKVEIFNFNEKEMSALRVKMYHLKMKVKLCLTPIARISVVGKPAKIKTSNLAVTLSCPYLITKGKRIRHDGNMKSL